MKPLQFILAGLTVLGLVLTLILSPYSALADDCGNQAPSDAPNLYQATASSSSATVYFVQPTSQFDSYTLSYGLTQSADAYSISFNMSRIDGAVKYTVNDLFPNTNYFFKVRASNGCAAGPWSGTISTNIQNAKGLPETGPNNLLLEAGVGGLALIFVGLMGFLFLL